jgi:hypothetical protein
MITQCSVIYNGEEDDLTIKSQNMAEKLRKELKFNLSKKVVAAPQLGFS